MNMLSKRIEGLSPAKRALLERLNRRIGGDDSIRPRADRNSAPASFAQQRLWFLDQLEPNSAAYNVPRAIRLGGALDVNAMQRALSGIVSRHEPYRTRFCFEDGALTQVISDDIDIPLRVADLSVLPDDEREVHARQLVLEEAQRPFDLAEGPLIRTRLLRLSDEDNILLLTMHHIVTDGWSLGVLYRELTALYGAYSKAQSSPLPDLPIQYADFATWQREWLQGEVLENQLSYWRKQLAGAPAVLELPTDHPRPAEQTSRGAQRRVVLSKSVAEGLEALSQYEGTTLFTTLLAAFQVLLSRYTGQEDIVVGAAIANRNRAETEGLIGFFVNSLVLRSDLSGNPTFRELLDRVREVTLGAYEHQDLPFEKLVEELQPERDPSRNALFQAMFVFQNAPSSSLELQGLSLTSMNCHSSASSMDFASDPSVRTDLDLYLWRVPGGIEGSFVYNPELFDAATIERMGKRFQALLENIVEEPDVALADLQIDEKLKLPSIPHITDMENKVPLSYHQERLWFIDQFETGNVYESSPVYHNMPLILHLSGPVNSNVIELSLNIIIDRHAALRTRVVTENGLGVQLVSSHEKLELKVVDLTDSAERPSTDRVVEYALGESRQPFTLNHDLPIRATLFRMGEEETLLVVTVHHLIADKESLRIIAEEFLEIYGAHAAGRIPQLPELVLQYTHYSEWQRNFSSEVLDSLLFYWKWQLRGKLTALELPEDRRRPTVHSYTAAREAFLLSRNLNERIKTLGREQHCDGFEVTLAAFKALLHRYSRQDEIVVGTSDPCRNQPEAENVVGPIANLLVLRSSLEGNPTFRTFLALVTKTVRQARAHREIPFDKLVQELKPEYDMSRTALFDVLFQFEDREPPTLNIGAVRARAIETNLGYGKYDINLLIQGHGEGLSVTVVYNADIYDGFTIRQMMRHFEVLLHAMTSDPDQRIAETVLLTKAEEHQQLVTWNSTQAVYRKHKSISQLFEEQVARTPDAIAVVFEDRHLTYAQLNAQANQLAHYLRKRGVGPEVLVGICAERSFEMVVGLLGILKAGGAYVPFDPASPPERLAFMIQDSSISVVLTQRSLNDNGIETARLAYLDGNEFADESGENLESGAIGNYPAYVIYTSGSTGNPKGVVVTHENVVRLFETTESSFSFDQNDVWTLFHSYAFDFSVWELWGALLYGGRIVIVPYLVSRAPEDFYRLLRDECVTVLNQTPSAFRQLIQAEESSDVENKLSLRLVIFGGEALDLQSLRPWFDRHGDQSPQLINMYGITETTVHVTYRPLRAADLHESEGSVIGGPLDDLQVYILDQQRRLLPIGVPGEMYVGGGGVSRGYLKRPDLTADRFVPDPFSDEPGKRLYRTGDLARYRRDGDVEYLGRIDNQVKLRGFRIELGEIEAALSQHPAVSQAVVTMLEEQSGDRRLVAYVVGAAGQELQNAELRQYLLQKLPDYMTPSAYVVLQSIPLTPNGKVDRRALPSPDRSRPDGATMYVAPRTPVEEALSEIWTNVLGVEKVGVNDNFFELGGDSILSIQIIAKANKAGLGLNPRHIFQFQTVAELAAVAGTAKFVHAEQNVVIGLVPLTPIQQWLFEQNLTELHHFNQAMLFDVRRPLEASLLERAIEHLLLHHDALRLRYARKETGWEQINCPPQRGVHLSLVDLSKAAESQQQAALDKAIAAAHASFNLTDGPLLRTVLFDLGAERPGRLLIVAHHLVIDAVSWWILLEDLQGAYEQLKRGAAIKLPPKTTSFKQWAERLKEHAQSGALAAEKGYWLAADRRDVGTLPVDHDGGENTVQSAETVSVSLSVDDTLSLLQQVPAAYGTQINDVLLTALLQAYARWTGESRLLLNLEGHGREEIVEGVNLSRTVGWFTTIFPVLLELAEDLHRGDALRSVRDQLHRIPNRGIGYGLLRYMNDARVAEELRSLPQPKVSFNYLGQFGQDRSPSDLFSSAREDSGPIHSPRQMRKHALDVTGLVVAGELRMNWTYSKNIHRRDTIESLANGFVSALRSLITNGQFPERRADAPADFPLANLDQKTLSKLPLKNVEDIYPLTPLQQGMLFHTLYSPDSDVYLVQSVYALEGKLNISAFKQAWQQVVDRHAVFRTDFVWDDLTEPLQVVRRQATLPWIELDWRQQSTSSHEEQLETYLRTDRARGFLLSRAPLLRLALIRKADDSYEFVCTFHHMLLDGWSFSLVFDQVFSTYATLCQNQQSGFMSPRRYSDYIGWLQNQDMSAAEKFWRHTLEGFTAPTPLIAPVQDSESLAPREGHQSQQLRLTSRMTAAIQAFARKHKLTMNTIVQGTWALLLSRYSSEEEIVFGAAVSGRPADLAGAELMVGCFINTLPVRVQVSEKDPVIRWLARLQEQQAEQRQYEYSPLVSVQEWSEVPRGVPLFETILAFENYPVSRSSDNKKNNLKVKKTRAIEWTNYPLAVVATPGEELRLKIIYDRRRLNDSTIGRLLGHFETLLQDVIENPGKRVTELRLLTEAEREQLIVTWNQAAAGCPAEQTIHELFEEQAEQTPDATAVVFRDRNLTYGELNRRANQVAHYLRARGAGPDGLVGLCLDRSVEMLVGMIGILKTGCAYVPLDPCYPEDRLAAMLKDARVAVVLTEERFRRFFSALGATPICLDTHWPEISNYAEQNPPSKTTADNLAYVIYTSGSTGKPKGVIVTHRGVVRLVKNVNYANLSADEVFLQFAPISFDASTFEIWGSLLNGARLIVMPPGLTSLAELGAVLRQHKVTTLWLTAGLFQQMVDAQLESLRGLHQLLAGGDVLSVKHVEKVVQELQGCQLINGYGPTENTTFTCCYRAKSGERFNGSVPIGAPISRTEVYILDQRLELVPEGVTGSLYIGGDGLARGYLNDPAQTAERFIPHPFSKALGARLYMTGDQARFLHDGVIEFLGRTDNQVKIRGYRIELGEIEAALGRHPGIRQCTALATDSGAVDKSLVAYIIPRNETAPDAKELRAFLRTQLPDYMIPAQFVSLTEVRLTPNGKIDRRALPDPNLCLLNTEEHFVAPRTPVEERLAEIWSFLLKRDRTGIHDNFFELGGHSLLATQVVSRIRQVFQIDLPLRALFESPTVASLGAQIQTARQEAETAPIVALPRDTNLPLSFAQRRLWFSNEYEVESAVYNTSLAVLIRGKLRVDSLVRALEALVMRHETLRTTFTVVEGEPVQVIAPRPELDLAMIDVSELSQERREEETRRIAQTEVRTPTDLSAQGPMRVRLVRLSEEAHALLITIHHIASDGWSFAVFARDLAALYEGFSSTSRPALPELPVQYADYAAWQRQKLISEVIEKHLAYWKQRLETAPPLLDLPTDKPRPALQTRNGARQLITVPKRLTEGLNALSRQEGVTLFMTLLAAFQLLLSQYANQDDIVVGTDVANRDRVELEGLIGFFINNVVLRTDLSNDPTFSELLARVRETALEAYAHQEIPFEKVVEALKPKRNPSYTPLFQVLFTLQNTPQQALELPGLSVSRLELSYDTTKYDLTLFMHETGQGLQGTLEYNSDLFDAVTVVRMTSDFAALLEAVVARPVAKLSELKKIIAENQDRHPMIEKSQRDESNLKRFKSIKPKAVVLTPQKLIKTGYLQPGGSLPLVVEPEIEDVDLAAWARSNREFIETNLARYGALLFRGFAVHDANRFERFALAIRTDLFNENGEHPREVVSGNVYTPVFYPRDKQLLWHNENSFNYRWPAKIWFCCLEPAQQGGETPIVDSRKVYSLIDPKIRERFERKQVMYVRNHWEGLGLSWQTLFRTTDKSVVEDYCRRAMMEFEWKAGDGLITRQVRPAVIKHPRTGEMSWFNQIQHWHIACLEPAVRESLMSQFSEEDLPRHAYYGDGSPIEDSVMEEILEVYRKLEVKFQWQANDILMVDNILTAHGRNPFVGERKLLVSMAEMLSYADV
jgi:amino acid adenylation domain-containing protein/non-ribosomal peptide synthase protein (TIGR01720 family)